jgi:hypothetical protein
MNFNQQILGRLVNILFTLGSGLFGVETEHRIFAHIKELGKAGLIMLLLPSHTTAALQPLDRGIVGPLEKSLNKILAAGSTPIKIGK